MRVRECEGTNGLSCESTTVIGDLFGSIAGEDIHHGADGVVRGGQGGRGLRGC
jgi:hypothetical protein